MSHAVDHGSENGNSGIVKLTASSLDLGEPTDIVTHGDHCAVSPAAQDERIGNRKDGGRVDDDQVVELAKLIYQFPKFGTLE